MEQIECVAIRRWTDSETWSLPRPARHGDVMHVVFDETGGLSTAQFEQGFLTTTGRFVNRQEAFVIAQEAGQLLEDDTGKTLFSEDVW